LSIKIFYDKINFRLHGTGEIKRFLEKVIIEENKVPGDLNFIFTDDKSIIEINREFIGHNYFTDVISFDYSENNLLQGEVYISVDTINENSRRFDVPRYEEVVRVMIHGVLHLCGYQDDTEENRKVMHGIQELRIKQFLGK
jgi:rRNA maturation RNase YbeY